MINIWETYFAGLKVCVYRIKTNDRFVDLILCQQFLFGNNLCTDSA